MVADSYMIAFLSGDKRAIETQHQKTDTTNRLNKERLAKRARGEGILDFNNGAFREGNSRDAIGGLPVGGTFSDDEEYIQFLHTKKKDGTRVTSGYTRGGRILQETLDKVHETAAKADVRKPGFEK